MLTLGSATAAAQTPPAAPESNYYYGIYRKSAEAGDAKAQFFLGLLHERGLDGVPDLAAALHWFGKAAGQGHREAQYKIGLMYHYGRGVGRDVKVAGKWYRAAADQGLAEQLLRT